MFGSKPKLKPFTRKNAQRCRAAGPLMVHLFWHVRVCSSLFPALNMQKVGDIEVYQRGEARNDACGFEM